MIDKYYIRYGDIPPNEISGIYKAGEKVGEEIGVSVYDAICINGEWRIVLPSKLKMEIGFDLYAFIDEYNRKPQTRKCYLVQGRQIGIGTTNEPLLKNIRIIQEL